MRPNKTLHMKLNLFVSSAVLLSFLLIQSCTEPIKKRIIIQDISWTPDNTSIHFSAMQVNEDYSNYNDSLWHIYSFEFNGDKLTDLGSGRRSPHFNGVFNWLTFVQFDGDQSSIRMIDLKRKKEDVWVESDFNSSNPQWSWDYERIAYNVTHPVSVNIMTSMYNGDQLNQITAWTAEKAYCPSWSPDGTRIAYYFERGDGMDQIRVMNSDGSSDNIITRDSFNNIYPSWIDNNTILYSRSQKGGEEELYKINADGSGKVPVLGLKSNYGRYSRDATLLAFVNNTDNSIDIVNTAGTLLKKITLGAPAK